VFCKQEERRVENAEISNICLLVQGSVVAKGIDVKAKTLGIEVDLVVALLQDGGDVSGILELTQLNVTAALLDGVTDQFGGTGFTLGADDHGLLLLAGLVDDEGGTLGFLLGDLLGFDCGGELGREGKVLGKVLAGDSLEKRASRRTVNETSSSKRLNLAARLTR
jgi:hypothetical protein